MSFPFLCGTMCLMVNFAIRLSYTLFFLLLLIVLCGKEFRVQAAGPTPALTYRYTHFRFPIYRSDTANWKGEEDSWLLYGREVVPPAFVRVDGDDIPPLPPGLTKKTTLTWDKSSIEQTLRYRIAAALEREAGEVIITQTGSGDITFDGIGFPGRRVDMDQLVALTITALDNKLTDVVIPVEETPPTVVVRSRELRQAGIKELVAFGESDYRGSPLNRRHNIAVGLDRFNGYLIEQGDTFSFNERLGPVNEYTGYRKELIIQGDKTLPDYGGGLCQVSTTAYRGVWEAGFPIVERHNHSYSVRYYGPEGSDATIYPPYKDVKFLNDTPGSLLIQTYAEDGLAYFLYYGTHDKRTTDVIGPFIWDTRSPPPDRIEYTTELPPGEKKKVGAPVPGMKALWYRVVQRPGTGETIESTFSSYEARPLYHQIGIEPEVTTPPSWLPGSDEDIETEAVETPASTRRFPHILPRYRRR